MAKLMSQNNNNNEKNKEEINTVQKPDKLLVFLDWLKTFLIVILASVLLTVFVIQKNIVQGPSMEPTLDDGDQVFVEKVSKYFSIKRGDIITIEQTDPLHPEILLIKRIIGLPGEKVEIKDGHVYLNDKLFDEPYISDIIETAIDPRYDEAVVVLQDDEYYVLGDNRPISKDSRRIGPVHKDQIIGKVLFQFYPFDEFGKVE